MITVDADVRRADGVALVTGVLANDGDRERTVRVRATVPVMPPRRRGVPERGWDGRTLTVRIPPETSRGVGFATDHPSVTPEDPPIELVDRAVAESAAPDELDDPAGLVRTLGQSSPPADAVPLDGPGASPGSTAEAGTESNAEAGTESNAEAGRGPDPDGRSETPGLTGDWEWVGQDRRVEGRDRSRASGRDERVHAVPDDDLPAPVADWLATVERRCDRVERTDDDVPLSTATETLEAAGGLAGLTRDLERLAGDARRLRALADRAETLAARAEAADLPVAHLEALA